MLFNSHLFLFLFLPLVLLGFFAMARRQGPAAARAWLIAASAIFYAWWTFEPAALAAAWQAGGSLAALRELAWQLRYVALLGALAAFTWLVGRSLAQRSSRALLAAGIAVLLLALGWFKYAGFVGAELVRLGGPDLGLAGIVLPLAISFFTFQKIAFLVDSNKGLTRGVRFGEFLLFVTFFPQLIAGPIVHWREVMPQWRLPETYRVHAENLAVGLTIFLIGLFKKAVLADGIAPHATPTFDAAAAGAAPDLLAAWSAALAYSFQLYFDFSGYSDMAIGAARLFGITLPLNFNSPYKATSIIDFWRRWHMTLSRFLRDYLYVALGGNRKGEARRFANLFITMLLGGLWHGAGWQFLLWGGLHGAYLMANHAWRAVAPAALRAARWWRPLAWGLTFLAVVIAWVPFRAANLEAAQRMLAGMAGLNGVAVPAALARLLPQAEALGVTVLPGGGSAFVLAWLWIAALLAVSLACPNTQEIMGRMRPALDHDGRTGWLAWRPSRGWAMATAVVATLGVLSLAQVSEFLYFQF